MKKLAFLAAATVVAGSAMAAESAKPNMMMGTNKWTINVGIGFPAGDHKDLGVDTQIMVGVDMDLGPLSYGSQGTSYVGLGYMFGSGDSDLDTRSWGVHYGVRFPLGNSGQTSALGASAQLGYYNTELKQGSAKADKWALGGQAALTWTPQGQMWSLNFGYYFMPEVEGVNNNGWFVGASFRAK
ncbi:MAG: hypothetical protein KF784_07300 [Fimbriimonadaceae bacterium]|nr:hypothetical protein [Fimbriimonadaceae bacterium]